MKPIPAHYYEPDEFGCLQALCWCGESYVWVPVAMIRAGQTKECGGKGCHGHR